MRVFLTGGSGFIGTRLAKALRERGDDVAVLVRQPAKAAVLEGIGCEVIQGLVTDNILIDRGTSGAEVVFHLAGRFEVGIKPDECPQMHDVNAGGVRRVLDSAIAAGCSKIVYVSTVNVFGNTRDKVVDESYKRSLADGFLSCYDESKY